MLLSFWDSIIIVLCFVVFTLCPFKFCNHLDGEEGAGCFALYVFLVSRIVVCLFLIMPLVCLQFDIVVFPDHTHLLFSTDEPLIYQQVK